jgi:hypothetical protein
LETPTGEAVTFKMNWPDREISVTPPLLSLEENPTEEIPEAAWRAFERLVAMGYTDHLIRE